MSFEKQIQQWLLIDNQIKLLNDKLKELRELKQKTSEHIIEHVQKNQLSQFTIPNSDSKLKFVQTKIPQPITFKYLDGCLTNIIRNETQRNQIINYIKTQREIKTQLEIKRV